MRPLSKLEVVHGALIALTMLAATVALGFPATPGAVIWQLLVVAVFSVVLWIALSFLTRRSGTWHEPLSDVAGRRIMGAALRAPFWLLAIVLAVIATVGWLKGKGLA